MSAEELLPLDDVVLHVFSAAVVLVRVTHHVQAGGWRHAPSQTYLLHMQPHDVLATELAPDGYSPTPSHGPAHPQNPRPTTRVTASRALETGAALLQLQALRTTVVLQFPSAARRRAAIDALAHVLSGK